MTKKNTQDIETTEQEQVEIQTEDAVETEAATVEDAEKMSYDDLVLALQEAQAKAEENWDQVLRTKAEMENARRRAELDVQGAHKFALEKFVNELLPVKDSLEMGKAAAGADGADIKKVCEGVELTLKMLTSAVTKFGVVEVNPEGEKFNPDLHQAMSMQDVPDVEPNTVVTVFQKGYQLNERLIRPAMVVVASNNSGANAEDKPSGDTKVDEMA
jgi:molecular chaperone GrpE